MYGIYVSMATKQIFKMQWHSSMKGNRSAVKYMICMYEVPPSTRGISDWGGKVSGLKPWRATTNQGRGN